MAPSEQSALSVVLNLKKNGCLILLRLSGYFVEKEVNNTLVNVPALINHSPESWEQGLSGKRTGDLVDPWVNRV